MTNTIPNVPRELLKRAATSIEQRMCIQCEGVPCCMPESLNTLSDIRALLSAQSPANHVEDVRAMVAAPSPAGVDGLEVVGYVSQDDIKWRGDCTLRIKPYSDYTIPLCRLSEATAIIDGLRGEVASQEETANQWRELALQFDRHRMTAMAHIRAAASGDKSAIEALGVFAALPPIPGHEITAERDQQARRIGELEGLLREVRDTYRAAIHWEDLRGTMKRIDAALSAGKEGE